MKLYTSKVVAEWVGLTERRVRQLRDEGVIAETAPGLYDLRATVFKYIDHLRGGGKDGLNAERTKLTAAKREAAEMDNEARRGDLHSTADVEKAIKALCLNIRGRLLIVPAKLAPALAARGGDQTAIYDDLKRAIEEALEELSDYRVSLADAGEKEDGADGEAENEASV